MDGIGTEEQGIVNSSLWLQNVQKSMPTTNLDCVKVCEAVYVEFILGLEEFVCCPWAMQTECSVHY